MALVLSSVVGSTSCPLYHRLLVRLVIWMYRYAQQTLETNELSSTVKAARNITAVDQGLVIESLEVILDVEVGAMLARCPHG